MSLADRLSTVAPRHSSQCKTCAWYAQLSDRDRAAFDELAARPDITRNHLLDLSREEEGLDVEETSFRRHMKKCHGRA